MSTYKRFTVVFLLASMPLTVIWSKENSGSPVCFKENKGQITDQDRRQRRDIRFYGHANGLSYFLSDNGISYQLYDYHEKKGTRYADHPEESAPTTIYRIDVSWVGANQKPVIEHSQQQTGVENFYNIDKPVMDIKSYETLRYRNIYPSVDLKYYSKDGALKYDYLVYPGGDYHQIKMKIEGASSIRANRDGSITIKTPLGDITEGTPLVYQGGKKLVAFWKLFDNTLSFDIKGYDKNKLLVIDPLVHQWQNNQVSWFQNRHGGASAIDNNGNVFWVGQAFNNGGSNDRPAFLRKISSSNTTLFTNWYAAANTLANDCVLDGANVYVVGYTTSYVVTIATTGAYQTTFNGGIDGFILKVDTAGVNQWATYYGGSSSDFFSSCEVDAAGNLYIIGTTGSQTNIASGGAYQATYGGNWDACLVKFNPAGQRIWATYYGGALSDFGEGSAITAGGVIYVAGTSNSTSGMTTASAYQSTLQGNVNAFIAKFDTSGARLYGSYYGADSTTGQSCSLDQWGNLYLSGKTTAATGIATSGVSQSALGGLGDAYLAKFNAAGARIWGTYLGGSQYDAGLDCATGNGTVYVSGSTNSANNIATAGSFSATLVSPPIWCVAFLCEFDTAGQKLWGTYHQVSPLVTGGTDKEVYGSHVRVDALGNVYLSGKEGSVIQGNPFIQKFTSTGSANPVVSASSTHFCPGGTVLLTTASVANATYQWYKNDTAILNATLNSYTASVAGVYKVSVTTTNGTAVSNSITVTAVFPPTTQITSSNISCAGAANGSISVTPTGTAPFTFSWNLIFGNVSSGTNLGPGTYIATITDGNGCVKKDTVVLTQPPGLFVSTTWTDAGCFGGSNGSATASGVGGTPPYAYSWSNGPTTGANSNLTAGTYYITVMDSHNCTKTDSVVIAQPAANATLSICAVTVDSVQNKNLVIWEKTGMTNVNMYNIYKENSVSGQYTLVGTSAPGALSAYLDNSSSPLSASDRYKISVVNGCSDESSLSVFHRTIRVTASAIGSQVNLTWNLYQGLPFTKHYVMKSTGGGPFAQLAQLGASATSYTDITPAVGQNTYRIEIDLPTSCNPTAKTTSYSRIYSNVAAANVTDIIDPGNRGIRIVPNPTNDVISIIGYTPASIRVLDIQGKLVIEETNTTSVSLRSLASGVYVVRLYDKDGLLYYYQKIVKE